MLKIKLICWPDSLQFSDLTRFSYRSSLFRVQLFVRLCFQTIAQSISMNSGTLCCHFWHRFWWIFYEFHWFSLIFWRKISTGHFTRLYLFSLTINSMTIARFVLFRSCRVGLKKSIFFCMSEVGDFWILKIHFFFGNKKWIVLSKWLRSLILN